MKTRTFAVQTAIAFGAALIASTASAASTGSIVSDVVSATGGNGQVNVAIDGSTATLTGYVNNATVASAARRAALEYDEIDEVIDLMSRN